MPVWLVADATRRISSVLDILTEYYCSEIPRHFPLLVLAPLVYVLVITHRFFQSLNQTSPSKLLCYEPEATSEKAVFIRQAAVIPPVFHRTTDKLTEHFLQPITALAASLPQQTESNTQFPLLITSKTSNLLSPACKQGQCMSMTYIYTEPTDEEAWLDTLSRLTHGPVPHEKAFSFEQTQINHATLPGWHETPFKLWPTDSWMPQVVASAAVIVVVVEWIRHILSHTVRCCVLAMFMTILSRAALSLVAAVSVASMIFPEFCFALVKSFLIVPVLVGTTIFVGSSRFLDKIPESSVENFNPLVRLMMACNDRRSSSMFGQFFTGGVMCALSLIPAVGVSPSLCPILFIYGYSLFLDFVFHYTLFLPVLYIDLVYQDSYSYKSLDATQVGLPDEDQSQALGRVPSIFSKLYRELILRGLALDKFLRRRKALVAIVSLTHIILGLRLLCGGASLLSALQPDLPTAKSGNGDYLELFIPPESPQLKGFEVLNVYKPLVITIGRGFLKATASERLLFGSLRYGNSCSMVLEIAALAVFIVSVGMIVLMLFVPRRYFDIKHYLPAREKLYVTDVEAHHNLDIMMLETSGTFVTAVSYDRKLTIADVSFLQSDAQSWSKHGSVLTLPLPTYAWPIKKLMLNPAYCTIALFYGHCIELWNWRAREMIYHFQHEKALHNSPLASFFVDNLLIFVTTSGRVVELYAKGEAKVAHVLHNCELKVVTKVSSAKSAHVLLLLVDTCNRIFKARRNVAGEWETEQLDIYESMLAVSGNRINTESPVSNGAGGLRAQATNPYNVPWTQPSIRDESFIEAVAMPDIELVLLVSDARVGFFDIHTGLFLRYIQIGNYVEGSIRALHSQPTHCAFCGCPAVLSISIAYMDADQPGTLVCHTYQLQDRHRNDICLRVERDPRETRCLGLMSTMEQCHWLEHVEAWEASEINTVLGVRRPLHLAEDSGFDNEQSGSRSFLGEIRRRVELSSLDSFGRRRKKDSDCEAFALSANGKLTCSEVSFDSNTRDARGRLLEDHISAIGRVGCRSVCIGVGNTLKILGLGQTQF